VPLTRVVGRAALPDLAGALPLIVRPLRSHAGLGLALLEQLMRRAGQVVTRAMLLEAVWNYDFDPRGNIVDMHMHRLRSKVDNGAEAPLIHTVAGAGYCIRPLEVDGGR